MGRCNGDFRCLLRDKRRSSYRGRHCGQHRSVHSSYGRGVNCNINCSSRWLSDKDSTAISVSPNIFDSTSM